MKLADIFTENFTDIFKNVLNIYYVNHINNIQKMNYTVIWIAHHLSTVFKGPPRVCMKKDYFQILRYMGGGGLEPLGPRVRTQKLLIMYLVDMRQLD